ncbi:MAG: GTP-binding protein, partial [Thiohalospira sp.]
SVEDFEERDNLKNMDMIDGEGAEVLGETGSNDAHDHEDHDHSDHDHDHGSAEAVDDAAGGFQRLVGGDAEHRALAWVFPPETTFAGPALREWFRELPPEVVRAKGVVRTGPRWQHFSRVDGELSRDESAWRRDSRVELLLAPGTEPDPAWEAGLLAARQSA